MDHLYKITISHQMIVCAKNESEASDQSIESYTDDIKTLPRGDWSIEVLKVEKLDKIEDLPKGRSCDVVPHGFADELSIKNILDLQDFQMEDKYKNLSLKDMFTIYQILSKEDAKNKSKKDVIEENSFDYNESNS